VGATRTASSVSRKCEKILLIFFFFFWWGISLGAAYPPKGATFEPTNRLHNDPRWRTPGCFWARAVVWGLLKKRVKKIEMVPRSGCRLSEVGVQG